MKILITGSGGLLGSAVLREGERRGLEVTGTRKEELDITDEHAVQKCLRNIGPEVVLNCASFTAVDQAESERGEAMRVNRDGAAHLARCAREIGANLIQISTDYVFDGKQTRPYRPADMPAPLNIYGLSKLAGEMEVRAAGSSSLVLRTSWLFGHGGGGFVSTLLRLLSEEGRPLRVVEDEVSRPTFVEDLAPALLDLAGMGTTGVLHLAGPDSCSRLALALDIRRMTGGTREISAVSSEAFGAPARRPRYSVLDLTEAESLMGRSLPPLRQALRRFLSSGHPD